MEAKRHDLRRIGMNDGFGATKGTGNGKSRYKTSNLQNKSQRDRKLVQCKMPNGSVWQTS